MGFANGRQTENFKISLKSPNTLKNTTPPTTGSSSAHGMPGGTSSNSNISAHGSNPIINAASLALSPAVSILPNVTSTNPKTPSPSTHEVICCESNVFRELFHFRQNINNNSYHCSYRPLKISLSQSIKFVMIPLTT